MLRRLVLITSACVLLALPTVASHGAPEPPQWMIRIEHDYNDDWGGHTSTEDGHDLVALDLQEAYTPAAGDFLVFRLAISGGYDSDNVRPTLRDVVTFTMRGQKVSREFRTDDNAHFTGDFDRIVGPTAILGIDGNPDGSRQFIEGHILASTLAFRPGDVLSEFAVQGYAGTTATDHMVGGYTSGGQRIDDIHACCPAEEGQPLSYRRPTYVLKGPVAYATSTVEPAALDLQPRAERGTSWIVTSRITSPQRVTLEATAPAGVTVTLHGPGEGNPQTVDLEGKSQLFVHVALTTTVARPSPLFLSVLTDLGGHVVSNVTLDKVSVATSSGAAAGRSPDMGPVTLLIALGGLAATRRRA